MGSNGINSPRGSQGPVHITDHGTDNKDIKKDNKTTRAKYATKKVKQYYQKVTGELTKAVDFFSKLLPKSLFDRNVNSQEGSTLPTISKNRPAATKKFTIDTNNVEVYGQDHSGPGKKARAYNAQLEKSRGMDDLQTVMDNAEFDMYIYDQIMVDIEENGFDVTLLAGKNSSEILEILKNNNLLTDSQIKTIKQEKVDLEGSPYW